MEHPSMARNTTPPFHTPPNTNDSTHMVKVGGAAHQSQMFAKHKNGGLFAKPPTSGKTPTKL
jgi:hypothetical protein